MYLLTLVYISAYITSFVIFIVILYKKIFYSIFLLFYLIDKILFINLFKIICFNTKNQILLIDLFYFYVYLL